MALSQLFSQQKWQQALECDVSTETPLRKARSLALQAVAAYRLQMNQKAVELNEQALRIYGQLSEEVPDDVYLALFESFCKAYFSHVEYTHQVDPFKSFRVIQEVQALPLRRLLPSTLPTFSVEDTQARCRALNCSILQYFFIARDDFQANYARIWLITPQDVSFKQLEFGLELDEFIKKTNHVLGGGEETEMPYDELCEHRKSLLSQLHQLLIKPITLPPSGQLVIIPHSILFKVSFPMLYCAEKQQYMLEQYSMVMAPSIPLFFQNIAAGKPQVCALFPPIPPTAGPIIESFHCWSKRFSRGSRNRWS